MHQDSLNTAPAPGHADAGDVIASDTVSGLASDTPSAPVALRHSTRGTEFVYALVVLAAGVLLVASAV